MDYKITLKKQINSLIGLCTTIILGTISCFAVYSKGGLGGLIYLIIAFSIVSLSVIFIHVQYLIANNRFILKINTENKLICYARGLEIDLNQETIVRIEKNVSNTFNGPRGHLPTDEYHYSKIQLKTGDTIIITSLLIDDFNFFKDKTVIKKRFIAYIK